MITIGITTVAFAAAVDWLAGTGDLRGSTRTATVLATVPSGPKSTVAVMTWDPDCRRVDRSVEVPVRAPWMLEVQTTLVTAATWPWKIAVVRRTWAVSSSTT